MSIPSVINNQQDFQLLTVALDEADQSNDAQLKYKIHDAALSTLNKALENGGELPSTIDIKSLRSRISVKLHEDKIALTEEFIKLCKLKNIEISADTKKEIIFGILKFKDPEPVPDFFIMMRSSYVKFSSLSDEDKNEILESVSRLTFLKNLDLDGCKLKSIPDSIGNLKSLNTLLLTNNEIVNIPQSISYLEKLETLSLQQNNIEILPESFGNLKSLKNLTLAGNNLNNLPKSFGNLKSLLKLFLSDNKLKSLPESFGNLDELEILNLKQNEIEILPESFGNLKSLVGLLLSGNNLKSLPESFGNLKKLIDLSLSSNEFEEIPSSIDNFTRLTRLSARSNRLEKLPESIGKLTNLRELWLTDNNITTLPSSIFQLSSIVDIELSSNPILLRGQTPDEVGREELIANFGRRVRIPDVFIEKMHARTKKNAVYSNLDKKPFRINRDQFSKIKMQDIVVDKVMGSGEMLASLDKIFSVVNMTDPNQPGYFSYDILGQQRTEGSNKEKIDRIINPQLRGYIKTLYGVPLEEEDMKPSMMMYKELRPETQKALTFIFNKLLEEEDPDILSIRFSQLTKGLLHCMTGQSEAINILAYSMLDPLQRVSGSKTHILDVVAREKNQWFSSAILSKAAENRQNVHLISRYRDELGEELGITAAVKGFSERIGTFGKDPFIGNPANVLKVFYDLVTPQRIIDWIDKKTQSTSDRQSMIDLHEVEKALVKQKDVNEGQLQGLRKMLERVPDNQKAQIQKRIDQLQKPSTLTDEEAGHLEEIAKGMGIEDVLSEDRTSLTDEGRQQLLNALRKKVKEDAIQRPITTGDMIQLMVDEKIIDPNDPKWEGLFSAPLEDPLSIVKRDGIKKVLIALGILIEE